MVVSADEEAVAGVAEVDMVLDERSALAPAPARSKALVVRALDLWEARCDEC